MSRRGASCRLGSLRPTARHEKKRLGLRLSLTSGKDALISGNGANALTVVAAVAFPVGAARIEVEAAGDVRVVRILRRRPVVAVPTSVAEAATPADTRSGQEDAIAIDFADEFPTVHAIERRPFSRTVVKQLLNVVLSGHTPVASPLHMCHVVFRTTDVRAKVVACGRRTVAMDVCTPVVNLFLLRLAPSVITTVFLGLGSSHVTACPLSTARQAEVNSLGWNTILPGRTGRTLRPFSRK